METEYKPVNPNWERVKSRLSPYRNKTPTREMRQWSLNVLATTFVGVFLGAKIGGRFLRERFIHYSKAQVYHTVVDARRRMHSYSVRGAVNLGTKWGWKVGIFTAVYSGVQISLGIYRDRKDVLNYVCAGAVAGPLFYVVRGIRPMVGGAFVGMILSVPLGMVGWILDSIIDWFEKDKSENTQETIEEDEE
ncbi:Complex I assembly factor TIMMDC1, mitochondrial-like [Oopsacas minuta]|uniref:Complex I assembly factor TIMMDC1, mitochondrial n=1 Tax=Oopsacas minuta TaxID=111878 RepID=A0AAV7JU46_9METZ|nr:Complex I assembly factor TIMMDC1, mitochondrial-like [Oopsacas minuta]